MSNLPGPKVERLIQRIHNELSGPNDWFVIVVGRADESDGGHLHVSGSNIDQVAALREAARIIEGNRS